MKVIITDDAIEIETDDADMPIDHQKKIDWSCRLAAHEACAWAMKRIGQELEKSVQFYRTGNHTDKISID